MACLYAMHELGVPFEQVGIHGVVVAKTGEEPRWGFPTFRSPDGEPSTRPFYTLRVCKGCRGEWMTAIRDWFRAQPGDVARWNNDGSTCSDDTLPKLLADMEKLRLDAAAVQQRIEDMQACLYREEKQREEADRRTP